MQIITYQVKVVVEIFDNLINIETKLRTISEKLESHLTVTSSTISVKAINLKS